MLLVVSIDQCCDSDQVYVIVIVVLLILLFIEYGWNWFVIDCVLVMLQKVCMQCFEFVCMVFVMMILCCDVLSIGIVRFMCFDILCDVCVMGVLIVMFSFVVLKSVILVCMLMSIEFGIWFIFFRQLEFGRLKWFLFVWFVLQFIVVDMNVLCGRFS